MNKEYKDTMNDLHFSEEQKKKMVERLMYAQVQESTHRKRCPMRKRTIVAVAAAAVITLTMGAGAVYNTLASESFTGFFGTKHTEIIDKIGRPIGVSDSDAGITITADAILGDKHNLNIVYTLAKEDGTPWGVDVKNLRILGMATEFPRYKGGIGGSSWFTDDDPEDNKIQYFEQVSASDENGIPMGRTKSVIQDIYCTSEDGQTKKLVEGKWILRFDLRYEDSGISLVEQPISVETSAGIARIEDINISPIGFYVKGYYEKMNPDFKRQIDEYQMPESGREREDDPFKQLTDCAVVLHLKNGTDLNLRQYAGSSGNLEKGTFTIEDTFRDEIYHLNDMESITVGDVTLPISTQK